MFNLSDSFKIQVLILNIERLVFFECESVLVCSFKAFIDAIFDALEDVTQIGIIIKHVHQAWTFSTSFFLNFTIDYRPV